MVARCLWLNSVCNNLVSQTLLATIHSGCC
jgi:hypothetical protein